ncbi:MAG TPA: heavy-metal-associated domain-containing protein [Candidatus Cybelea sp.]|nr:heavy-metal-associated domain-containing protein [Candidatus Cybelea sp.]
MTAVYKVTGMTCDGCVRSITRAIQRAVPGAVVAVELAAGRVKIETARQDGPSRQADDAAVRKAIVDAGYGLAT